MTERLPVVGTDTDTWGTVLNGFLGVAHNADGTLKNVPVKSGLAQISGGALQYGIPTDGLFTGTVGTTGLNANQVRYVFVKIHYAVTLTAWEFEVTTAPASNANVRIGIYKADAFLQPTGAPLYDGTIAVASGFTGIKSASGLSIALTPGMHLIAINIDVAMSMRAYQVASPAIGAGMGATPIIQKVVASQTYGAMPNPGTAWTTTNEAAGGMQHSLIWQWSE